MLGEYQAHGAVLRRYSRSVSKLDAAGIEVIAAFRAHLRSSGRSVSTVRTYGTLAGEFVAFTATRGGLACCDAATISAWVRSVSVPSGIRIGAFSQRSTYSMTHFWSVWRSTAFNARSQRTESKKLRHIKINNPVLVPAPLTAYLDRIQRRPAGTVPVGIRVENLLHRRLQCEHHYRLRHPVRDIRDGDFILPILAVVSGDLAFSMMFLLVRLCQRGLTSEASQQGNGVG